MSADSKIHVDAGQPTTLNDGGGKLTDCATLQEAVLVWHALPSAQKIRATVKVIGGRCTRRVRSIGFTTGEAAGLALSRKKGPRAISALRQWSFYFLLVEVCEEPTAGGRGTRNAILKLKRGTPAISCRHRRRCLKNCCGSVSNSNYRSRRSLLSSRAPRNEQLVRRRN